MYQWLLFEQYLCPYFLSKNNAGAVYATSENILKQKGDLESALPESAPVAG